MLDKRLLSNGCIYRSAPSVVEVSVIKGATINIVVILDKILLPPNAPTFQYAQKIHLLIGGLDNYLTCQAIAIATGQQFDLRRALKPNIASANRPADAGTGT